MSHIAHLIAGFWVVGVALWAAFWACVYLWIVHRYLDRI